MLILHHGWTGIFTYGGACVAVAGIARVKLRSLKSMNDCEFLVCPKTTSRVKRAQKGLFKR